MSQKRESYHDYMGRRMREEDEKTEDTVKPDEYWGHHEIAMSDRQMVEHLRTHAHWTVNKPWVQIADRLEQLSEKEKV